MRSKCPEYVINPSVMRDPGIPYTAMSLCAAAKVFASPRTVFTQMDAAATAEIVGRVPHMFSSTVQRLFPVVHTMSSHLYQYLPHP